LKNLHFGFCWAAGWLAGWPERENFALKLSRLEKNLWKTLKVGEIFDSPRT